MAKRGRPRHPDILTPREWDVLALLRESLTNEAIGLRLGITERTVKYHVGEILGKLGLASRHEAAAWQPGTERSLRALAGAPFAFLRSAGVGWISASVAGTLVLVISGGLVLLAWSLLTNEASLTRGEEVRSGSFDRCGVEEPSFDLSNSTFRLRQPDECVSPELTRDEAIAVALDAMSNVILIDAFLALYDGLQDGVFVLDRLVWVVHVDTADGRFLRTDGELLLAFILVDAHTGDFISGLFRSSRADGPYPLPTFPQLSPAGG